MLKYISFLSFFFVFLSTHAFSAKKTLQINNQPELGKYWQEDIYRTNPYMPVDIAKTIDRYNGDVTFNIKFKIDEKGDPSDFEFISAIPAAAAAEAKYVRALYLWRHYKPTKLNSARLPVQFNGQTRWWDPDRAKSRDLSLIIKPPANTKP